MHAVKELYEELKPTPAPVAESPATKGFLGSVLDTAAVGEDMLGKAF